MASGIDSAAATASAQMIARHAGEVEHLGAARVRRLAGRPPDQIAPPVLADQREQQIAMRVGVVHGDDQLAETGLAEVLGQQLGVAPPELRRRRPLQLRRAAHQIPHHAPAVVDRMARTTSARAARATTTAPTDRRPFAPPAIQPSTSATIPAAPSTSSTSRGSQVGSASGANAALREPQIRRDQPAGAADADHLQHEVDREHDQPERHRGDRNRDDRQRRSPSAQTISARDEPPLVEPLDPVGAPEALVVPQPLRAVDRREQRADHADAAAGDDVELDAGFVERAQHAGVIGAGGAGAGQDERGAALRRVRFGRLVSEAVAIGPIH